MSIGGDLGANRSMQVRFGDRRAVITAGDEGMNKRQLVVEIQRALEAMDLEAWGLDYGPSVTTFRGNAKSESRATVGVGTYQLEHYRPSGEANR